MPSIKISKQIDETGCGIACASMVSNKGYEEVRSILMQMKGWKKPDRNFYTKASDLLPLLEKCGLKAEIKKSSSWNDISGVSIVGVNRGDGYFHWVVSIKDSKRFVIIDPKHGELLNGDRCIKKKRYKHGKGKSNYLSIPVNINSIKI